METRLKASNFNFYSYQVKARNPKTNEIKMVDWMPNVFIEKTNGWWHVHTCSKDIMKFWIEKFGDERFNFPFEKEYKFYKLLKETANFVTAPYIPLCPITKEWIQYEIID